MHLHQQPVLRLRPTVNRWLVAFRVSCLLGLLATSVSIGLWTLVLGAALALSYRWSATRLAAAEQARSPASSTRNPLRGKPAASTIADLSEQQLLDLRADAFADAADGAEDCEALRAFEPVRSGTACIFARRSRLWGAPDWRPRLSLTANAAACTPRLRLFCRVCGLLGLDGFVLRLPAERCTTFRSFSAAVLGTLSSLAACEDPDRVDCMRDPEAVSRNGWVFRFHGQTFFVTTFAPFYGQTDSRFSYGAPDGFVLLQPELSFAQHDLPEDTAVTNWDSGHGAKQSIRDRVRCAFRDAGQTYRIRETVNYPMIEDIVMLPKEQTELQGVRWWEIGLQDMKLLEADYRG